MLPPLERTKRALARAGYDDAKVALDELDASLREAGQPTEPLTDVRDALAPDAYWRAVWWKRVLVIFAGPGTNALFAVVVLTILFMLGGGKPTTTVAEVLAGTPAAHVGLHAGDRILAIDNRPVKPTAIAQRISTSNGRALTILVDRRGRLVTLGPVAPKKSEGVYRLGFVLKGKGLPPPAAA